MRGPELRLLTLTGRQPGLEGRSMPNFYAFPACSDTLSPELRPSPLTLSPRLRESPMQFLDGMNASFE
jgi:hypothetical protein